MHHKEKGFALKQRLLMEDDRCSYCGEPLTEETATMDHVIPRHLGGTDDVDNLTLACEKCNRGKGNIGPVKFALREAIKNNLVPINHPKIRSAIQRYLMVA